MRERIRIMVASPCQRKGADTEYGTSCVRYFVVPGTLLSGFLSGRTHLVHSSPFSDFAFTQNSTMAWCAEAAAAAAAAAAAYPALVFVE